MLAGRAAAEEVLRQTGVSGDWRATDGDRLEPGGVVVEIEGPARAVLTAERTLLNLLCHLSGIATLTAAYVDVCGDGVRVLDTRKTTPGLRRSRRPPCWRAGAPTTGWASTTGCS